MTSKQAPIQSGFSAKSTASEVLGNRRLDGVLAIMTGGYAGVGLETTRVLTGAGATVIVPARTPDKARAALAGLERVELEALDLADPKSIDAFAARFLASKRALPLLINNAGIMATPLARDARGFESQLATNHIGHFQLTARLWPALQANGARVIALTSAGHRRSGFDFEDPNFERREYDKWVAYGQSKTANALFARELDRRGEARGVRAFSVHPGAIETDLMRHMPDEEKTAALTRFKHLMKNVEQGAATSVWCATSTQLEGRGGVYCENADIARETAADSEDVTGVRPWATDPQAAEKLWTLTEGWTGLKLEA
jgi:NAD(P)-dependent dehydrogenase (short-subunit alcohol dehydrogenase family)